MKHLLLPIIFRRSVNLKQNFTETGQAIASSAVIITTGTFLKGEINIGLRTYPAGRMGDKPAIGLADALYKIGFKMNRMKTGILHIFLFFAYYPIIRLISTVLFLE